MGPQARQSNHVTMTAWRMMVVEDEDLLMVVLNSAPVVEGLPTDQFDSSSARELLGGFGGTGTAAELLHLQRARTALQSVVRGEGDGVECLTSALDRSVLLPEVTESGVQWRLDVPAEERLAVRAVLAWSRVIQELPGRLRACANTECNLFLIDHSRPGTAKWCSMSTCGNRMKARTYARRTRG